MKNMISDQSFTDSILFHLTNIKNPERKSIFNETRIFNLKINLWFRIKSFLFETSFSYIIITDVLHKMLENDKKNF